MRDYSYFVDENGNGWIANHINGYNYPLFDHPEVNENSSQQELANVCDLIESTIVNSEIREVK